MKSERKRKLWLAGGILGVIAGVAVVLSGGRGPGKVDRAPAIPRPAAAVPARVEPKVDRSAAERERSDGKWSVTAATRTRLRDALATNDPKQWAPVLGDLANPMFDRDEVAALLREVLGQANWYAKVQAARLLLELGFQDGVPALNATLKAAAAGEEVSWIAALTAVSALHQYRQEVDAHDIFLCYQRFDSPELLAYAALHGAPEVRDVVAQKRAEVGLYHQTVWLAAIMGMSDTESMAEYHLLTAGRLDAQLLGHWALYRMTADPAELDQVIAMAKDAFDMNPATAGKWREADNRWESIDYLQITIEPKTTKALEEIADFAATNSTDGTNFSAAFGALFYLHKDYDFIDRRLLEFFQGHYEGLGIAGGMMMQIAATRHSPQIEAAAKAFNPRGFEYVFEQTKDRPVESWWHNLIHVPTSVAPPLARNTGGR